MTIMKWIENWYSKNCDGDWEHSYGVKIETVDNPGWSVEINLIETNLENEHFETVEIERNEDDWFYCIVRDSIFNGAGGTRNLEEILNIFREWASKKEVE